MGEGTVPSKAFADLTGRRAVVTGAGVGLGRAIAYRLHQQGARVAVADVDRSAGEETKKILGGESMFVEIDVGRDDLVAEGFAEIFGAWGEIDILVNNAGVVSAVKGTEGSPDTPADWDSVLNINLRGTVRCCEAVVPSMKERRYGKIVNLGSMSGHGARRNNQAYAVSKAAIHRYTTGLAAELAEYQINVNAVCPGAVWTTLQERGVSYQQSQDPTIAGKDPYDVFVEKYASIIPMGRPQTPEEIGNLIAFVSSDDAASITGQLLNIDGGAIIT